MKIIFNNCSLGAIVCAVVINRLLGDSITDDITKLTVWEMYPQQIVAEYIKQNLSKK